MLILTKEQVEVVKRAKKVIDYVSTRYSNIRVGMEVCNYEVFTEETKEKKRIEDIISGLKSIGQELEKLNCFNLSATDDQELVLNLKNEKLENEQQKLQYVIKELQVTICKVVFSLGTLNGSVDMSSAMLINLSGSASELNAAIQPLIKVLNEIEIK